MHTYTVTNTYTVVCVCVCRGGGGGGGGRWHTMSRTSEQEQNSEWTEWMKQNHLTLNSLPKIRVSPNMKLLWFPKTIKMSLSNLVSSQQSHSIVLACFTKPPTTGASRHKTRPHYVCQWDKRRLNVQCGEKHYPILTSRSRLLRYSYLQEFTLRRHRWW